MYDVFTPFKRILLFYNTIFVYNDVQYMLKWAIYSTDFLFVYKQLYCKILAYFCDFTKKCILVVYTFLKPWLSRGFRLLLQYCSLISTMGKALLYSDFKIEWNILNPFFVFWSGIKLFKSISFNAFINYILFFSRDLRVKVNSLAFLSTSIAWNMS